MNIYFLHSSKYDYFEKIYNPIKKSKLFEANNFYFPHEGKEIKNTKNIITTSDLVIAEISIPSISQGIEIGWADSANVPILFIYEKGTVVSDALKLVTANFIEYENTEDMINKIEYFLGQYEKTN